MAFSNVTSHLNQDDNFSKEHDTKSTLSLLNEICQFNRITFKFLLIKTSYVDHCKLFEVSLTLSNGEKYVGKGSSIRKAEREAALDALKHTKLKPKPNLNSCLTPTVKLNELAMKLRQKVDYEVKEFLKVEPQCYVSETYNSEFNSNKSKTDQKKIFSPPRYVTCVKLGDVHFHGKGQTAQLAKHSAAEAALKVLSNCAEIKKTDKKSALECKNLNQQSSISALYSLASKKNCKVKFESECESELCHIPTFIVKCIFDDHVAEGKGSSKKLAKEEAAQKLLQLLNLNKDIISSKKLNSRERLKKNEQQQQEQQPLLSCIGMATEKEIENDTKIKSSTSNQDDMNEKIKSILEKADIDPIGQLIQLQSAKREGKPEFNLIAYSSLNSSPNPFVIECTIPYPKRLPNYKNDKILKVTGRGSKKKIAKANAAKSMLKLLNDLSTKTNQDKEESADDNMSEKKLNVTFSSDLLLNEVQLTKNIAPKDTENNKKTSHRLPAIHFSGVQNNALVSQFRSKQSNNQSAEVPSSKLHLKSEQEMRAIASTIAKESMKNGESLTARKLLNNKLVKSFQPQKNTKPSQHLNILANALSPNVHINYHDTPISDHKWVTVVNVSFIISQSFAGSGDNIESSRESAALFALKTLAEDQGVHLPLEGSNRNK